MSCTHVLVCLKTVPHVGNSVLRGDAVIRAMMWVVTRHMHGRVSVYVKCIVLNFVLHDHIVGGLK